MQETKLQDLLDTTLLPFGFERNKRGIPVYKRAFNGQTQEIGLRKGVTGGKEFSVYFEVPEEDTFYELSHLCPLKNSYWWPENLSEELANSLHKQLKDIALAYFNSNPKNSIANAHDIEVLQKLLLPENNFKKFEGGYWRIRGDVIDIIDIELLVNNLFAYIYLSVWHRELADENVEFNPKNITRITSCTTGNDRIDNNPNSTYFNVSKGLINITSQISSTITDYFDSIKTIDNVKDKVRPEFRCYIKSA